MVLHICQRKVDQSQYIIRFSLSGMKPYILLGVDNHLGVGDHTDDCTVGSRQLDEGGGSQMYQNL